MAAYEVIRRKGSTNHAIGLVTAGLVECLLADQQRVLTVSRVQEGAFGLHGVALSLPALVGRTGATRVLQPSLDNVEHAALMHSAKMLRAAQASVDLAAML